MAMGMRVVVSSPRVAAAAARVQPRRVAAQSAMAASGTDANGKKLAPLQVGGTRNDGKAAGLDAASVSTNFLKVDGDFSDPRWVNGTWDFSQFAKDDGETDWDAVIDAEIVRRRWLEVRPEGSSTECEVTFTLEQVPWFVWVKRFHLPQAEMVNGRACMVGYVAAMLVEKLTGATLLEQQFSFLGAHATVLTVLACLFIRDTKDVDVLKGLVNEATYYDSQWQATWQEGAALPEDAAPGPSQAEDLANPPKMQKN